MSSNPIPTNPIQNQFDMHRTLGRLSDDPNTDGTQLFQELPTTRLSSSTDIANELERQREELRKMGARFSINPITDDQPTMSRLHETAKTLTAENADLPEVYDKLLDEGLLSISYGPSPEDHAAFLRGDIKKGDNLEFVPYLYISPELVQREELDLKNHDVIKWIGALAHQANPPIRHIIVPDYNLHLNGTATEGNLILGGGGARVLYFVDDQYEKHRIYNLLGSDTNEAHNLRGFSSISKIALKHTTNNNGQNSTKVIGPLYTPGDNIVGMTSDEIATTRNLLQEISGNRLFSTDSPRAEQPLQREDFEHDDAKKIMLKYRDSSLPTEEQEVLFNLPWYWDRKTSTLILDETTPDVPRRQHIHNMKNNFLKPVAINVTGVDNENTQHLDAISRAKNQPKLKVK